MTIQLTDVIPVRAKLNELTYNLRKARLNFLDLKSVPCIYMHEAVKEKLMEVSGALDKAFYYEAVLNKTQRSVEWTQDGELTKIETDPFSIEVRQFVEGFIAVNHELGDIYSQLRDLISVDLRKPVDVDPDEIFDTDAWIKVLEAVYVLSCRCQAIKSLKDYVDGMLYLVFKVVTVIANIQTTDKAVMIPVGESDRDTGLPEIVLSYQEKQVFFSDEEIEKMENDKREREARLAEEDKQRKIKLEVGSFKEELVKCLVNTQWEQDEQDCVNDLFGNLVASNDSYFSDEMVMFLKTFKWYLEVTTGTGSVENGLREFITKFTRIINDSSYGSGYVIAQNGMLLRGLNAMIKFFIDAGYTVETLESMTTMDGSLTMTTLHEKETMVVYR